MLLNQCQGKQSARGSTLVTADEEDWTAETRGGLTVNSSQPSCKHEVIRVWPGWWQKDEKERAGSSDLDHD